MSDRRTFLKQTAAIGGAVGLSPLAKLPLEADVPLTRPNPGRARAPLNILILGGTGFTGPEQVDYAIARGHRVTLFNRGRTRPGLFKGKVAEELIGDLNSDASALKGKTFDVVIDNPTTLPVWVKNAAQYLKGNTKHYIFISTTSVYRDQSEIGINENSPTVPMPADLDPYQPDQRNAAQLAASRNPASYGALKARSEVEVQKRELGTYNAIGPDKPLTIAEMLYGVKAVTTAGAQITWVPWEFLQAQGIRPWSHMPVWMPPEGRTAGYQRRSAAKALTKGLTFRPVAVTAKDTLDWHKTRPAEEQAATLDGKINGLSMKREAEVLAAWKEELAKRTR